MSLKALVPAVILCSTVLVPGMVGQRKELIQLLRDVALLQESLRQSEQANSERMAALEALLSQNTDKQDKLSAGQAVLERNIATLDEALTEPLRATGAKVDSLNSQFSDLRATVEEAALAIERMTLDTKDIKTHLSTLPPPGVGEDGAGNTEAAINASDAIFEGGMADYLRGNIDSARGQFMDYLALYPTHSKAGESQYYLAETYYSASDYEEAVRQFEQVYERYPLSARTPDALLKLGMCRDKLRDKDAAIKSFEDVIKRFPDNTAAQHARSELNRLLNAKPAPGL